MKIGQYDGIGVFFRGNGFYVEHYRSQPNDGLMIIAKRGPFDSRLEAELAERKYRSEMIDS